jgi:hypothetical protein
MGSYSTQAQHVVDRGTRGWFVLTDPYAGLEVGTDGVVAVSWPFEWGFYWDPNFALEDTENGLFAVFLDSFSIDDPTDFRLAMVASDGTWDWSVYCGTEYYHQGQTWSRRPRDLLRSSESALAIPIAYRATEDGVGTLATEVACTAYSPANGDTLWNLVLATGGFYSSMDLGQAVLGSDGTLNLIGQLEGETVLWRVAPDHQSFDQVALPGLVWSDLTTTEAVLLPTGDLAFVGSIEAGGSADATVFCLSPEGQLLWQRVLGDPGVDDVFNDAVVEDDGTLAVIGTHNSGYHQGRLWLRRFDPAGNDITP